jgi:hypothetical protein
MSKQHEMTVKLSRKAVIEVGYWLEEALRLNPLDPEVDNELRAFVGSIDEQLLNAEMGEE